ncbi:MAG: SDR family oxidoreductase [Kyrpidia tusciae]|nr:SDR family oxidoreductase [Kyrpidia tusciae]MBE3552055.1 SDR family oxidoreductase [Kyrpidia tusciae]
MGFYDGRCVAIVGASRGIGQAIATRLSGEGAEVILFARNRDGLLRVAETLPGKAHAFAVDVTSAAAASAMAEAVERSLGRLDALIYSAGVLPLAPVSAMLTEEFERTMNVNFWGAVRTVQGLVPILGRGGMKSIVLLSSLSTHFPLPFFAAYCSSKMALRGFAASLRQELAPQGFHVGLVSPGPVDTAMVKGKLHTPLYRVPPWMPLLRPEDVSRAVDRVLRRRRAEAIVPGWLAPLAWLGLARPSLVMGSYRFAVPGWEQAVREGMNRVIPGEESPESRAFNQNHS